MITAIDKLRLYAWGAVQLLRLGRPQIALGFLGGIGDDLLCTAPIEEWLRRGAQRLWFFTRHPALYSHFDERVRLVPEDPRLQHLAARIGRPMHPMSYSTYDSTTDRDSPLAEHLLISMCRRAGLSGRIRLRPHLPLSTEELAQANQWSGYIALQTSSLSAAVPMRNKQWPAERYQLVVDYLISRRLNCVQVGAAFDPMLLGAADLRNRTTLRETASVLANARLFVGVPGFLMHLARAVDCPSVIIYGGREPPELTGYICNLNIDDRPPCATCWQRNRCDHAHVCMESIGVDRVIAAINEALGFARGPLVEQEATL